MSNNVWVTTVETKYGTDTYVYATKEIAQKHAAAAALELLDEDAAPAVYKKMREAYDRGDYYVSRMLWEDYMEESVYRDEYITIEEKPVIGA